MTQAELPAHEHEHSPHLAHHWSTLDQQFEAGKLGMWLFLATEVLLFGGLFCGYTIWRFQHPEMFKFGSRFLDTTWGAINTAVLIASSLTMATAVTMAQRNRQKELVLFLALTLAGALGFLGIKYVEYSHKFHEGFFPGRRFYERHDHAPTWDPQRPLAGLALTPIDPTKRAATIEELGLPEELPVELSTVGPPAEAPGGVNESALERIERAYAGEEVEEDGHGGSSEHGSPHPMQDPNRPRNAHMFFNIYFMMTGLHGVHVAAGGFMLIWLIWRSLRGHFSQEYFTPVDLGGLYWHVVDLIWIFLFPLFYLI